MWRLCHRRKRRGRDVVRPRTGGACTSLGWPRYFGYHRAKMRERNSHADLRIIAEGFYQDDGRCRRCNLRPCRGCPGLQASGLQATGSEETDPGRRSVSRPAEGERKLRELSVFRISQELRRGRGRHQRDRLVSHLYDVFPARSRRAWLMGVSTLISRT
jgi:hypothetical protein